MKIFLDIGHPAHVHYFKNFIRLMMEKGHHFAITARDKEFIHLLLKYEGFNYYNRGPGKKNSIGKFFYMFAADKLLFKQAKKFKPDIFLSFASPYAAQVSWIFKKPHIVFDDTAHAKFNHLFYRPFSNAFINPTSFNRNFGENQIKFDSYMELCYLHPNYFKADNNILNELGVRRDEKYAIIRFVSWGAQHDIGQSGLNYTEKIELVRQLDGHCKIFISSEDQLPENLNKFRFNLEPQRMHDALAFADLFIGEGATMASESACLGTPAIYVNSLKLGYVTEQEKKYGLVFHYKNSKDLIEKARELIKTSGLKSIYNEKRNKLIKEKIDPTAFMVWLINNWPKSFDKIKKDPEYQYSIK